MQFLFLFPTKLMLFQEQNAIDDVGYHKSSLLTHAVPAYNYIIIIQIAYSSSAITLSNRQKFVNFFRTYPSDVSFGPAMVSLLQYYGWNQIVIITEEQNLFTAVSSNVTL